MTVEADDSDSPIPDDCLVYRVLNDPEQIKETGQPKSSGFSNSSPQEGEAEDDCYMSVFLEDQMAAANKTTSDLLEWWGRPAKIAVFTAGDLRALGEAVARHPIPQFPGHGGVYREDKKRRSGGQKNNLVKAAKVI